MDPAIESHFRTFALTSGMSSTEEAFLAGWDACRRHYDGLAPAVTSSNATDSAMAESIYAAYPRKVGKGAAIPAIRKAMVRHTVHSLYEATRAYAEAVSRWPMDERQYVPHPSTWFNRESYLDDPNEWQRGDRVVGIKVS